MIGWIIWRIRGFALAAGLYGGYGDLRWRLDYMADTGICVGWSEYMAERFDASGNFVLVLAAGFVLWPVRAETSEQSQNI